jgi:hypothetical protein
MINILAIIKNDAQKYHRIELPLAYLNEKEFNVKFIHDNIIRNTDFVNIDILYLHYSIPIAPHVISLLKEQYKFQIIVDFDDSFKYPINHLNHYTVNKGTENSIIQQGKNYAILADYITTTTTHLQTELKKYNKNVVVFPNRLPYGRDQFKEEITEHGIVKIGIIGSISHNNDWNLLRKDIYRLCIDKSIEGKFNFVIGGYNNSNDESTRIWNKLVDMIDYDVDIFKAEDCHNYMQLYNTVDILLAPLEDNHFNRCKSELKILECACKNVLFIGSKLYEDKGNYKIYYEDYFNVIKDLILNPIKLKEQKLSFSEFNRKSSNFDEIIVQRENFFKNILDDEE